MNLFPNKVLLATDGSEDAALAARAASDLSIRSASELHVVHVWQPVPLPSFESSKQAQLREEAEGLLKEQVSYVQSTGGGVTEAHLREGRHPRR